jgi:hypothetical protein
MDADDAASEWITWVKNLPKFIEDHPDEELDAPTVMEILLKEKGKYELFPIMRQLSAIALSLSFSTAIVESTFSIMKLIKNYRTNAMSMLLLDDLLNICCNGPDEMPVKKSFQLARISLHESGERHFRADSVGRLEGSTPFIRGGGGKWTSYQASSFSLLRFSGRLGSGFGRGLRS